VIKTKTKKINNDKKLETTIDDTDAPKIEISLKPVKSSLDKLICYKKKIKIN